MNQKEIESLKLAITGFASKGAKLVNEAHGLNGRLVGVGFRPYWTIAHDSKIEKLEFNIQDSHDRITPFYLYNIVGYDILSYDSDSLENSKIITIDIHVIPINRNSSGKSYEKINLEIICNL